MSMKVRFLFFILLLIITDHVAPILGSHSWACPPTLNAWDEWKTQFFAPSKVRPSLEKTVDFINGCLATEAPEIKSNAKHCTKNLLNYLTENLTESSTHQMFLDIPDAEYFSDPVVQRLLQPPEELLQQDILKAISEAQLDNPESLQKVVTSIQSHIPDAKVLPYDPRHPAVPRGLVPSFDSPENPGRLLVVLDGERITQYFQFTIHRSEGAWATEAQWPSIRPDLGQMSAIAVQKTDRGADHRPPYIYFQDFMRRTEDGQIKVARALQGGANRNCMSCHISGPIEIHGTVTKDYKDTVADINRVMRTQSPAHNPYFKDGYARPALGSPLFGEEAKRLRPDEDLRTCSTVRDQEGSIVWSPSAENLARIRNGMNCGSCHGMGKIRGPIRIQDGFELSVSFVDKYLRQMNSMPPHPKDLSSEERAAIFQCLKNEYDGLFLEWLKGPTCEPARDMVRTIEEGIAATRMSFPTVPCAL